MNTNFVIFASYPHKMAFTKRQTEIINGATKLIGAKGIQNLTTKNLAAELNISEPSLYRHFKNKQDILQSILRFYQTRLENTFGNIIASELNGLDKVISLIQRQFEHFSANPAMVMVIMAESSFVNTELLTASVCRLVGSKKRLMESMILIGQQDGSIRSDLPVDQLATMVMGSMRMTVLRWRLSQFAYDLGLEGETLQATMRKLLKL